ncbi:dATP/dGTP pyrophosphohydrolase domain-containing protein [Castellaniella sp. S9]|uniref:dATP/dGTP pyrophosphohydrolase domain-containing protein n=1 Tax=Castellaniella sp. S9 TaxID=2993652 RepID=UPI0022B48320|nr:dATP/dGTP pyrophosphohydrolase domain-containing protein [Castellaniella sp. S9]
MTIYISGPMTGMPDYNYPAFNAAAASLRSAGYDVFNPAQNGVSPTAAWTQHMRVDITALMDCDGILMLDGWMQSKGARLERHIAVQLDMPVHYEIECLLDASPIEPVVFDFIAHLQRQREWSARTFGPGPRAAGVVDHIRKELAEIQSDPGDVSEWIDVVILALDGAWRSGASPQEIIAALAAKQAKNESRAWPDWRTADPDKAIEHDRSSAASAASPV